MAEGQVSDKQLIEALLRERDELYRRATKAERRLEELSDAESMRQQYETRIKEMNTLKTPILDILPNAFLSHPLLRILFLLSPSQHVPSSNAIQGYQSTLLVFLREHLHL